MDPTGIEDALIQKKIIYSGSKFVPLVNGTKVCVDSAFDYHFILQAKSNIFVF